MWRRPSERRRRPRERRATPTARLQPRDSNRATPTARLQPPGDPSLMAMAARRLKCTVPPPRAHRAGHARRVGRRRRTRRRG
eukprot:6427273-Prymnesium_polylepis.1